MRGGIKSITFFIKRESVHSPTPREMSQNTPLENELFALIGKLTLELEREREKVKEAKKMEKLLNDQLKFERRQSGLAVPSLGIAHDINELPPIPPLERNSAKYYP